MNLLKSLAGWIGLGMGLAAGAQGAAVPALTGLSGNTSLGTVANSATVTMDGRMTLEAWLYPTGWRSYDGREKHGLNFIYKGRLGSHVDYVFSLQENGILCLGDTWGYIGVTSRRIPLNTWTHVAVAVQEGGATPITFYINGENVGGGTAWQAAGMNRNYPLSPSSNPLYIGGFNQLGWGYNNDNFIGKIADVRIWSTTRTAEEIAANFRRQLRGNEAGLNGYWTFADVQDKSGHGNRMSLSGSAGLTAGAGPDLQGAGGMEVTLAAPADGAVGTIGEVMPLRAVAQCTSGGVSRIDFKVDGVVTSSVVPRAEGTNWVATYDWVVSGAGAFRVTAVGTNAAGFSGTSRAAAVRVPGPWVPGGVNVPGTYVEAEDFDLGGEGLSVHDTTAGNAGGGYRPTEDVDISACAAARNGYTVGWTAAGEWLKYTLNVQTAGTYGVTVLAAAMGANGTFTVELGGTTKTFRAPNTGSWTTFGTVRQDGYALTVGVHTMKVTMVTAGNSGNVAAFDAFRISEVVQEPYEGRVFAFPALLGGQVRLEAERYDEGGEGKAYHDTTPENEGGAFRGDGVDIAAGGTGYVVGWTSVGEWLEYTVNVPVAGKYGIAAHAGVEGPEARCSYVINGETFNAALPDTGSWSVFMDSEAVQIDFVPGIQTVRVAVAHSAAPGDVAGNYCASLDYFNVTLLERTQVPYPDAGVVAMVPGVIQFENFDMGGEDVAYHDTTPGNAGKQYRLTEDVDITAVSGTNYCIGWTPAGEWLEYTVNVASTGVYRLEVSAAAVGAGGTIRMSSSKADGSIDFAVPDTGNWSTFKTLATNIDLMSGVQTVRVEMVTAGRSGNAAALDWFRVSAPPVREPWGGTPAVLPGVVQAENFDQNGGYFDFTPGNEGRQYRLTEDVDIALVSGTNYSVGWTLPGEWLEYTVNVQTEGDYMLSADVAAVGQGGQIRFSVDGTAKTGHLMVPNTGSWNAFQRVGKDGVPFTSGIHTVRVEMVRSGTSGYVAAVDSFAVMEPARPQPYGGTPAVLPGVVQAENFDLGGASVAYQDGTPANEGKQYRLTESVDISRVSGTNYSIGWTLAGEWLQYTVNVQTPGLYVLSANVAGVGTGGRFRMMWDGVDRTSMLTVPNTGSWDVFQRVGWRVNYFSSGIHILRVEMMQAGTSGYVGAFDSIMLTEMPHPQPYGGTEWVMPGEVQAENFDTGGEGVAYHDTTATNEGKQYRLTEGVDIALVSGTNYSVGWTPANEWMIYTVNVQTAGLYTLSADVASVGTGGRFRILVDGTDVTGMLDVPDTGAWNVFQRVGKDGVPFSSGIHVLRVETLQAGTSGYVAAFDSISMTASRGATAKARFSRGMVSAPPEEALTSNEAAAPGAGWLAVDGDTNTVWRGTPGEGGWWLALAYDPEMEVSSVTVDAEDVSAEELRVLYSADAEEWVDWEATDGESLPLRYLWLLFTDEKGVPPAIREVTVE